MDGAAGASVVPGGTAAGCAAIGISGDASAAADCVCVAVLSFPWNLFLFFYLD